MKLKQLLDSTLLHQAIDLNDPLHAIRSGRLLDSCLYDFRKGGKTKPSNWVWGYYSVPEGFVNKRGIN